MNAAPLMRRVAEALRITKKAPQSVMQASPWAPVPLSCTLHSEKEGWTMSIPDLIRERSEELEGHAVKYSVPGYYFITDCSETYTFRVDYAVPAYGRWSENTWRLVLEDPTITAVEEVPPQKKKRARSTTRYNGKYMPVLHSSTHQWTLPTPEVIESRKHVIEEAVIAGRVPGTHAPGCAVPEFADFTLAHWRMVTDQSVIYTQGIPSEMEDTGHSLGYAG